MLNKLPPVTHLEAVDRDLNCQVQALVCSCPRTKVLHYLSISLEISVSILKIRKGEWYVGNYVIMSHLNYGSRDPLEDGGKPCVIFNSVRLRARREGEKRL